VPKIEKSNVLELSQDIKVVSGSLVAAMGLFEMSHSYQQSLNSLIFFGGSQRPDLDLKDSIKAQNKIRSEFARELLTLIWKESDFVPEEACVRVGFTKNFVDSELSKNGLAKAFCEVSDISDLDKFNAIRTDIGRVAWAAEAYGLISQKSVSGNSTPIYATEKLHELMIDFHGKNMQIANRLVLGADAALVEEGNL